MWKWPRAKLDLFIEVVRSARASGRIWVVYVFSCGHIWGSLRNYWHPPSRTKTKYLFINLRFNCFRVFPGKVESSFGPFQPRLEERRKVNFWRGPQRRPYTITSSLCCEQKSLFRPVSKTPRGVNNLRVALVDIFANACNQRLGRSIDPRRCIWPVWAPRALSSTIRSAVSTRCSRHVKTSRRRGRLLPRSTARRRRTRMRQ